jgi:uncharacterized protein YjbJ (UPF0337 family)
MQKSTFSLQTDEVEIMDVQGNESLDVQSNEAISWADNWILSTAVEDDGALNWVENSSFHVESLDGAVSSSTAVINSTVTRPRPKKISRVIVPTKKKQDRKGRVQERTGRVQERTGRVQDRKSRIEDRTGRVQDRTGRVQDRSGRIEDRSERVQVRRIAFLPIDQSWDFENPCQK